ncbi:MAG TPA: AMP-binding protein, partial [Pyrinomonadaceae bacterium]|nr:AMP-binding protein [Pyrinomonadaceae bacterium]
MRREFVHEWFSRTAAEYPSSIAIETANERITYAELERRSDLVAQSLYAGKAAQRDIVAIFANDGVLIIEAIIGILKRGCAFVTVSPELPDQRIHAMLEIAKPVCAIVEPGFDERFQQVTSGSLRQIEINASGADSDWKGEWQPDDLCYIFFTSGSTGGPKGIAGRLKAIDHFIRWEINEFGFGPGVRVSQLTAPSFDAVLRDIFVPLCAGGTICIPPARNNIILDGAQLVEWLDNQAINVIHTVPSIFRNLVENADGQKLERLTHVLLSGERLTSAIVKRWFDAGGERTTIVNLYGPTETTMTKFFHVVTPADLDSSSITIGKPMPGTKAILLNEDGHPCAEGAVGEIIIRTPHRSLGYYGAPELTSQVFVR